jgi:hypothetical protein
MPPSKERPLVMRVKRFRVGSAELAPNLHSLYNQCFSNSSDVLDDATHCASFDRRHLMTLLLATIAASLIVLAVCNKMEPHTLCRT